MISDLATSLIGMARLILTDTAARERGGVVISIEERIGGGGGGEFKLPGALGVILRGGLFLHGLRFA